MPHTPRLAKRLKLYNYLSRDLSILKDWFLVCVEKGIWAWAEG